MFCVTGPVTMRTSGVARRGDEGSAEALEVVERIGEGVDSSSQPLHEPGRLADREAAPTGAGRALQRARLGEMRLVRGGADRQRLGTRLARIFHMGHPIEIVPE